jgi:hypothetical protein
MNRKERLKRNMGGTVAATDPRFKEQFFDGPARGEIATPIALPERLIRAVLVSEVERLSRAPDELRRFFTHFFDPTTSEKERETYVTDFQTNPPRVVLNYPRSTGSWPCFAIVLSSDEESEVPLAQYIRETAPDERPPGGEDQEYEGAFFDQTISIYVIGTHPDQCAYLYKLGKLMLMGARNALVGAGLIDPRYSGGELNPDEMLLPDNAFARVLTVNFKVIETIPAVLSYRDGRKLRLTGIFGRDIVVDGMRGGVNTYAAGEDEGDGEEG